MFKLSSYDSSKKTVVDGREVKEFLKGLGCTRQGLINPASPSPLFIAGVIAGDGNAKKEVFK